MTKAKFNLKVNAAKAETHDTLALVWGNLNHGQQQKMLKNAEVVAVLKRYGVIN